MPPCKTKYLVFFFKYFCYVVNGIKLSILLHCVTSCHLSITLQLTTNIIKITKKKTFDEKKEIKSLESLNPLATS